MKDKLMGAVIVTYNPTEEFYHVYKAIKQQIDMVVIVNNSDCKNLLLKINDCIIISNGKNLGIAEAFNIGILELKSKKIDYVVTFDQDTIVPKDYFQKMLVKFEEIKDNKRLGLLAPHYTDKDTKMGTKHVFLDRLSFKRSNCSKNIVLNGSIPISSGSVYDMCVFNEIGLFRSEFFIDYVDTEFCLRLLRNNYEIMINCELILEHKLGERSLKKIFFFLFNPTNHSYLRKYYITRNRLKVLKEYAFFKPSFVLFEFLAISLDIIRILCAEEDKLKKFKYMLYGVMDFCKNKFGEFSK